MIEALEELRKKAVDRAVLLAAERRKKVRPWELQGRNLRALYYMPFSASLVVHDRLAMKMPDKVKGSNWDKMRVCSWHALDGGPQCF